MTKRKPVGTMTVTSNYISSPGQFNLKEEQPAAVDPWKASGSGRRCPECHREVDSSARSDCWMQPAGWEFYGEKGKRFIVCQGDRFDFVHFRVVLDNGRDQHRLFVQAEDAVY